MSFPRRTPVLGVDVGEHSVKYVLVSRARDALVIEAFGIVELKEKGETVKDPFAKIRSALAAQGFTSYQTVAGISGQSVFLRFVRLPPVPKRQMDQIVRYEAQQQVPFPIEEVRWDYQVLSAASQEERDVVLVAAKNEIVEQAVGAFQQAGFRPLFLDASVLAIYNCLTYSQSVHPGTSGMILDIGGKTTHMIVADRGGLWVRSIPIAGNHMTHGIADALGIGLDEAERIKINWGKGAKEFGADSQVKQKVADAVEKTLGRLFAEISRSLGFYRSLYPGAAINEITLCGGGALLQGLDQAAKERFNLPVKRLDSLIGFRAAREQEMQLQRSKFFLAGALGLALRRLSSCRLKIDLVPHEILQQRLAMRRVAYVAATCFVLMMMGVVAWVYASRMAHIQQLRTDNLDIAFRSMESLSQGVGKDQEQVEILRNKFQCVDDVLSSAQMFPDLAVVLAQALPDNFWLVRITGEKTPGGPRADNPWGSLVLEGKTAGDIGTDLPLFRQALSNIPLLSGVEIASAQVEKGIVEFTVKMKVRGGR